MLEKIRLFKENVCPRWACNYLQKHINKGNKHWEEKGGQWEGNNNNICSITHVTELAPVQTDIHPSHKKKKEKKKDTTFKNIHDLWFWWGGLRIKWCILTMLNEILGGKECRPTYASCCALACQPPADLAINLQYKRSLISGSLILKWIIIWLHHSSPIECQVSPVCGMTSISAVVRATHVTSSCRGGSVGENIRW